MAEGATQAAEAEADETVHEFDFARFCEGGVDGLQQESEPEEWAAQRDAASAALAKLVDRDGQGADVADRIPEHEGRRLVFQGALHRVVRCGGPPAVQGQAPSSASEAEKPPKRRSVISGLLRGSLRGHRADVDKGGAAAAGAATTWTEILTAPTTRAGVAALSAAPADDGTMGLLFDDILMICKKVPGPEDKMVLVACVDLLDLSVREMGSGVFTFEDGDIDDDDNDDGDDDDDDDGDGDGEAREDSHAPGMEHAKAALEVRDASDNSRFILDAGDSSAQALWLGELVEAAAARVSTERPMRASEPGWRHGIRRGTIWAAAQEGNLYQVGRILRWTVAHPDEAEAQGLGAGAADDAGASPLHYAAASGASLLCKQLLGGGADVDAMDNELQTPLHLAARGGHLAVVRSLLVAGADVNARNLEDESPLLVACAAACAAAAVAESPGQPRGAALGGTDLVSELADHGADFDLADARGNTALSLTILRGCTALASALLRAGAKPDCACGPDSRTALAQACASPSPKTDGITLLLSWGANPNARDRNGDAPLHILAALPAEATASAPPPPAEILSGEKRRAAALLLARGARADLSGASGRTAAELLTMHGVNTDEAVAEWQARTEPEGVEGLARDHPYRIPFATGLGAADWLDDKGAAACMGCATAFGLVVRRHHCRRCGKLFCAPCCSKSFTLTPQQQPGASSTANTPAKAKVCVGCFNSLCRSVSMAVQEMAAIAPPAPPRASAGAATDREASDRKALFGSAGADATAKPKPAANSAQAKASGLVSSTQQALASAKETLLERGEKLSSLADSSEALSNNAAGFSSLATKLREREERKSKWFGGLL